MGFGAFKSFQVIGRYLNDILSQSVGYFVPISGGTCFADPFLPLKLGINKEIARFGFIDVHRIVDILTDTE